MARGYKQQDVMLHAQRSERQMYEEVANEQGAVRDDDISKLCE